ncbi:MAG: DUF480 domain-containing protein [bacterium]|nr:DUF480 domain-containing protein [bacterium]
MRLPRELDSVEVRVLGALLEKQQTTPDYYPLTVNALLSACNQRSNRHPVMELDESDITATLDRLHEEVLVWPVQGSRVDRWRHNLDRRWELDDGSRAIMTLLLLRGAQTPGELRGRSTRMHSFQSTGEVEQVLSHLAQGEEPLVVLLPRQAGQKEARWTHLVTGPPSDEVLAEVASGTTGSSGLRDRVQALEDRVARLEEMLQELVG